MKKFKRPRPHVTEIAVDTAADEILTSLSTLYSVNQEQKATVT